jgi:hypothetical protein
MKILQKQTLNSGEEESMSSQADFLASLSPSQVRERERMITVTSGRTCSALYEKSDPLGLLVKTLLESSRWFSPARRLKWEAKPLFSEKITEKEYCYDKSMLSKPSVKTLSEKDIPSSRCLFRLVPSERPTEETGYGLLPTVQTQGLKMCDENGKTRFYPMELLPTPMATDIYHPERVRHLKDAGAETMASRKNGSNRPNGLMDFMDFHGMLPTPMASDATTGAIIGKNDHFIMTGNGIPRKVNQNGINGSVGLARIVQLLPTPNAREADKYSKKYNPNSQMGTALTAMAVNGMLPTPTNSMVTYQDFVQAGYHSSKRPDYGLILTPTASCRHNGCCKERKDGTSRKSELNHYIAAQTGKTSQLNPLFVEEMMGFPLMWTTLPFLSQNGDKNQLKDTETP